MYWLRAVFSFQIPEASNLYKNLLSNDAETFEELELILKMDASDEDVEITFPSTMIF